EEAKQTADGERILVDLEIPDIVEALNAMPLEEKLKFFDKEYENLYIKRKEYGEIPMDDRPHTPSYASRIYNLGTVGGFTKPSTGYTFSRVHKYSRSCAKELASGKAPLQPTTSEYRFRYYDLLLLRVLSTNVPASRKIFRSLFKNSPVDLIFKFLSEETSFIEDLKVLSSCHYPPFLKALTVHPPFLTQFKTHQIESKPSQLSSSLDEEVLFKHNDSMNDVEMHKMA
ncbi:MAG: lycopene cyclase family protein, partial [Bacteroidota bacterium]